MLINRERLLPTRSEHPEIRGHRRWLIGCGGCFVVALVWYVIYQSSAPYRPRGGSLPGLIFGMGAALCMVVPALLTWRKRYPGRTRWGRAQTWMKAHIWLGLLSLPLALFHTGFRLGGLLESALMFLVFIVWGSGVLGLALQQFLPSVMLKSLPAEAMAAYVDAVCLRLQETADKAVLKALEAKRTIKEQGKVKEITIPGSLFADQKAENPDLEPLRVFYLKEVRPYLDVRHAGKVRQSGLNHGVSAEALFESQRNATLSAIDPVLEQLKPLCDERRTLQSQIRMHSWLHGWLWIHVPLSMTLLVLLVLHTVSVLMY